MKRLAVGSVLAATLLVPQGAHAAWPPGQVFTDGVALDVTPTGFEHLAQGLPAVVPATIDLPVDAYGDNFYVADYGTCCDPLFGWICWTCWEYEFAVSNGAIGTQVDDLTLVPRNGYLDLSVDVTLSVNGSSDPMELYAYGEAGINDVGISISVDMTCDAWADPFQVSVSAPVYLEVVNTADGRQLQVDIPHLDWSLGLSGNDLHLASCFLGDFIDFVQSVGGLVGFDPIGTIIDLLEGVLDDQIQALVPDLEAAIEDAFAAARVEQQVDLNGATLDVLVEPYDVVVTPAGMRVQLAGSFDAPAHVCVTGAESAGSLQNAVALPALGSAPSGVPQPHDLGIFASDDFANSGLYAAWRAGLLCVDLSESDSLPLNTSLLTLLSRDAYEELFDESRPIAIVTRPRKPPAAAVDGPYDVTVEVRDLDVDLYAELDGRMARMLGTDLATDVGIDFAFDGNTGELLLDIAFDPGAIEAVVEYDEITVAHTDEIEGAFTNLFDTVVSPLVGDLLAGTSFALPSFGSFGLTDLVSEPAGSPPGFFGLFGYLGTVTYEGAGCADGGSSCSGGCQTGSAPGALMLLLPGLLVLRRRR